MTDNRLSVEMLPARQGDALWIEWGEPDDRHRMLIDGGLSQTFSFIRDRFEALDEADRHVDLMVVTHIDLDHIAGSIKLLEDDDLGITFGDVWFNDYRHLGDGPAERGAMQGEVLAAVLTHFERPWNQEFGGGAVVVPDDGPLPSVTLPGGLELVLLSPSPEKLLDLKKTWEKTLKKKNLKPGERSEAVLAAFDDDDDEAAGVERGGKKTFGGDPSTANGSSIAFIAEYRGQRWLLAGDAHEDVLAEALDRYGESIDEMPVRLDGFKLPHHGSMNNITEHLLSKIVCSRFLISSDGSRFKHPDEECIDLIVDQTDRPELIFNYTTEFNERWQAASDRYTAIYPDTDDAGITTRADENAAAAPIGEQTETEGDEGDEPADDRRLMGFAGSATAHAEIDDIAPLEVQVVHGSIDRATHPVIVGHYQATPLSGAEGFLDGRTGGRLSDRLARDLYPGEIGESLFVASPRTRHPAGGTLVIGLGEYGELTPMRLVESIRAALVRYALDCADRAESDAALELGISSVLVGGTGDQGLSVAGSVRAIVDGVLEANVDLRSGSADARAVFTCLQLWEYNPQNAELAFRAVPTHGTAQEQGPMNAARAVKRSPELVVGEGALTTSMPVDTADAAWRRIRVAERASSGNDATDAAQSNDGVLELDFGVTGRLARAGVVAHRVERRRLQRILQDSVGNHMLDQGIPTTLFELLFPNELKWDLMSAEHIQLEVDELTADIPWEMLAARNPREDRRGALALRAPLVRQLRLADPPPVRRASRASALVIGNPPVGHLAAPLAGAYRESEAVAELLGKRRHGYDVRKVTYQPTEEASNAATLEIEKALFERDYRIVHVAAHGFFNPDDSTRSGIAIGPDSFLTADMIGQLNVVPDVVFLNCCHLGSVTVGRDHGSIDFTRRRHNELGASLARRLIERGVRAVVVAGWAVADQAAEDFAIRFYEEMLDGSTFGDAVHKARLAARIRQPNHSTWGAYQCYGDGGYKLPIRRRDGGAPRQPATVREALHRLERLVSQLESAGTDDGGGDWFVNEIETIELAASARRWFSKRGNGELREQLGEAWATLGNFEAAIGHYAAGMKAEDAAITLRAIEQLANLHDRRASEIRRCHGNDADDDQIEHHLNESDRLISILGQIGATGERLALDAGRMKRRAVAMQGDERRNALSEAARRYLESYKGKDQPYTILNYLQLEEIRARLAGDEPDTAGWRPQLDQTLQQDEPSPDADYWADIRRPDAHLTQAITSDRVDTDRASLEQMYRAVFNNRSRASQRKSTLDHVLDLADLHPDEQQSNALRALHNALANNNTADPAPESDA